MQNMLHVEVELLQQQTTELGLTPVYQYRKRGTETYKIQ